MIEDLNITLKLLRDRKSQLIEKIKNSENDTESNTLLNNIFEIDIKIKEYNEKIKNQSIDEIEYKINENNDNKIINDDENQLNITEQKIKNNDKNNDSK